MILVYDVILDQLLLARLKRGYHRLKHNMATSTMVSWIDHLGCPLP